MPVHSEGMPARPAGGVRSLVGVLVAIVAVVLMASGGSAAAEVASFEGFARLFGDTAEAQAACRFTLNSAAVDAAGEPFQESLDADVAAEKLAKARADAATRRAQMSDAAFCAEMLKRYGPDGQAAKGLLKP